MEGEVALEEPGGVPSAFALGDPFLDVALGLEVVLAAVEDDRVQCLVELTVAATAEPVSLCLAA